MIPKMHLFLDIEGLTKHDIRGGIFEIGAVVFSFEDGPQFPRFYRAIKTTGQNGLAEIEAIAWHEKHGLNVINLSGSTCDLFEALTDLRDWIEQHGPFESIWSWGSTYDFPRLEYHFRRMEIKVPWEYHEVSDARTVWKMAYGRDVRHEPRPHKGIEDCLAGIEDLIAAFRDIRAGEEVADV